MTPPNANSMPVSLLSLSLYLSTLYLFSRGSEERRKFVPCHQLDLKISLINFVN